MSHTKNKTTGRKKIAPASSARAKAEQGIPLIVVYWAIGLSILSYTVSRFVFTSHPLHWASAAAGLLLGAIIGYIWFLARGDVGLI